MKPADFIKESVDQQEYNDEAGMAKNSLHTIVRVATHLERELGDNENLPEWCQEKIAQIKGMMVSVMDYMISQHEMGKQEEVPSINMEAAYKKYEEILGEDAGCMGSASVAAVVPALGGNPKKLKEKTKEYSNVIRRGGPVKVKK